MADNTIPPICPYCGSQAKCESDRKIYGRSYGRKVWVCVKYPECDSYVGCHRGGNEPLGRMANVELRDWKKRAHGKFDKLWNEQGWRRNDAYGWLAGQLGITRHCCHIGMFDVEQCQLVVQVCERYMEAVV